MSSSVESQLKRLSFATDHIKQNLDRYDVGCELTLYTEAYHSALSHLPKSGYESPHKFKSMKGVSMNEIQPFTATTPISSVEITENAKGEARVTVKVYNEDVQAAAVDALIIYRDLVASLAREG